MTALALYTFVVFFTAFMLGTRLPMTQRPISCKTYKARKFRTEHCPICLSKIKPGEYVSILECGHAFHKRCVSRWILSGRACPCCRAVAHLVHHARA